MAEKSKVRVTTVQVGPAFAHRWDDVILTQVAPAAVALMTEGRVGDQAVIVTTEVRAKARKALDDIEHAVEYRDDDAYQEACARLAACGIVLLLERAARK